MFVFEDLLGLEDLALRRVLEEITDNGVLAKHLKLQKKKLKRNYLHVCLQTVKR